MDIHYLFLVVVVLQGWQPASGLGRCTYKREFKMLGANCFDLNFEDLPKNLNTDIEILNAGKNRIRTLTNSSLRDYTSLRYLYLGDNFIQKIEAGAFSELEELEVLDLSKNALISLPEDLPLPLRRLYLAENQFLRNISLSAAFNLNFLNLAKCDLKQFPSLGILPNLQELNISDNPLQSVTPADLAPLCRLNVLHLPPSLYSQSDDQTRCQCHRLLTWSTQRYINLTSFTCTPLDDPDAAGCEVDLSEEKRLYKSCLVATPASTSRNLIWAILAGFLLLAVIVIVCWWRKSRRKKNSVQDQKRIDKKTKAADTLIT